jgi:3-hydroxyacyl-CoA dehydrogenase
LTKPFQRIAVVGTGTLGAQIALLAANAGYSVTVYDQRTGALDAMIQTLDADLSR